MFSVRKSYSKRSFFSLIFAFMLWIIIAFSNHSYANIPVKPEDGDFLHDYASVLSSDELKTISRLQQKIIQQTGSPVVVVTINRIKKYSPKYRSIERLARKWFNTWGIGSQKLNTGVLILVSIKDRQARIELGASWGFRWDKYCKYVMDHRMIPKFKTKEYGEGIIAGIEALRKMIIKGADSKPPELGLMERIIDLKEKQISEHPLKIPRQLIHFAFWLGIILVIGSFFSQNNRKMLLGLGIGLILATVFFYVLVFIFLAYTRFYGRSSGGGFSGGGFGGGFSGGGGASGSW